MASVQSATEYHYGYEENHWHKKLQMLKYIRNLLDSFHSESLKHWISSNLEETDKWLYKATNGVPLNESEQSTFYHSWVFVECICDLIVCDDTCTIVSNFPYVYELLLKELSILKKNQKVPNNPIINGFIFESEFLQGIPSQITEGSHFK